MKALSKANQALLYAFACGYRVDDDGTCRKPDGGEHAVYIDRCGYSCFNLLDKVYVHRLAALQRRGAPALFAQGVEVRHLNNDKLDNSHANIALGTRRDNYHDNRSETNARKWAGAREARRKLSDAEVLDVVRRVRAGETQREVAVAFGVSNSAISYILMGRTYNHVTGIIYVQSRPNPLRRKLSDDEARQVVIAYHETGASQGTLSRRFGVTQSGVGNILRGRIYADVTADLRQLYAEVANDTTREERARATR